MRNKSNLEEREALLKTGTSIFYLSESDKGYSTHFPGRIGTRHLQVLLMFLGMLIGYSLRVTLSVAIVAMTDTKHNNTGFKVFDWNKDQQANVLSSFLWGYIVTQIPFGYLAATWSARKLLFLGIGANGVASLLIPWLAEKWSWQAVCAARVCMGLGQGCLLPGFQTLLSRWVPPSERARLGAFTWAGAQLGTVFSMGISGQLAGSSLGWPSVFYTFGAVGIGWALLFLILGSDSPSQHPSIRPEEREFIETSINGASPLKKDEDQNEQESATNLRTPWKAIFTSVPMWALIIVHCGQNWGFWLLLTQIPTYMSKILKYDIKDNGFLSALPYLAMWLLSFPVSWLSDYALQSGVSRGLIRKTSNSVAHWGPAIALFALCYVSTSDKATTVALLVVAVGLNAGSVCGFQINHIDLSPNFAGALMSITNCIATVVAIYAPKICNWIVIDQEDVEQWHTVFYMSTLIYFLGNLIFVIFGSGEVQSWNDPSSMEIKHSKTSYPIATITSIYTDPSKNTEKHKTIQT
ncbi:hypothetical protein QAD02_015698 [Eretmocerus hayati]|uniref:Uncharacterized protein n=1 Tax=Eretmocerus hayati TaxID=131215 RepID=A0ACC2P8Z7_9HYME|nr:hypothetical protein QAD02_015698 [Eretmocerus hayati]